MMMYEAVYDISVLLCAESIDYPGDTPSKRTAMKLFRHIVNS
jgi:hypothetical protein